MITRGESQSSIQSINGAFANYYTLSPYVSSWNQAVFVEAFGTAFLVFCIFAVTHRKNYNKVGSNAAITGMSMMNVVPIVVGSAIAVMVVILGPLTGAGINPGEFVKKRYKMMMMMMI